MNDKTFFIGRGSRNKWNVLDRSRAERLLLMKSEYQKYWRLIEAGENFMFLRAADGERALMLGKKIQARDGWHTENELSELGKSLIKSLTPPPCARQQEVVYGISCPCCDAESYFWYLNQLSPHQTVSFSNIWVNANFADFKRDFMQLKRDAVLITNYRGKDKTYGQLNVIKHYFVDDDCVNFWSKSGRALVQQIIDELGDRNDLLYVFSAGPLSEVIMVELFKHNPNNAYVDFGSALDFITREGVVHGYMNEASPYAHQDCWMFDNKKIELDIDVVLTAYKRPQVLAQQLDAVRAQTIPPKNIFLFQDGIDSYYEIELKRSILDQFDGVKISSENVGVWGRFEYARRIARSKYVCLFDDDTIPGARWFENCLMHMLQERGVYGTNGILLKDARTYPNVGGTLNAGWHSANERTIECDFVGHSWFVEREYLDWMFEKPYAQKYKCVGEDMCISFACQEHHVSTYVPDHPLSDESLWGSQPQFGYKYGTNEAAVSINSENIKMMNAAFNEMHADGWKLLVEREPKYILQVEPELSQRRVIKQFSTSALRAEFDQIAKPLKILLPLIGKKYPVFMTEQRFIDRLKSLFGLRDADCVIINDENNPGVIRLDKIQSGLRKYAVHILFTAACDQLKPHLERLGLREAEDFIDGRGLLALKD